MFTSALQAPLRLLLVDSDARNRDRTATWLTEAADPTIDVVEADSVTDVRTAIGASPIDCLVCATAIDGDRDAVVATARNGSDSLPVFHFTSDPPADEAMGTDGRAEWIDASTDAGLPLLTARVEARCTRRRLDELAATAAVALSATSLGFARIDDDGRITGRSQQFAETIGLDERTSVDESFASLYASLPAGVEAVLRGDRESWTGELDARTPDGEHAAHEYTVVRTTSDAVTCVVHPDPGPAKRERLLTEQSMLDSLMERLPISIYFKDEEARHVRVSQYQVDPPTESHEGEVLVDPAQFVGKTDLDIYEPTLARQSYEDDLHVIESGEPIIAKVEHTRQFGEDMWSLTSKMPWTDREGTVRGLVGATLDVTAEKQHEREIERQRERLEEFASVVTHDLRNPLSVAQGYLTVARETDDEAALGEIEYSLERMEQIIGDVLALARQGQSIGEPSIVRLQSVVQEAWEQVDTGDAELELFDEIRFKADRSRLLQLIENLVRNAVEHGGEDVTVTVETLTDPRGFALEDDGPGIPPDERERVFESGYTTSADGTGFGLAIVEQIVDAHGWWIDLVEGRDGGARFEITGVGEEA